jgi:hypothetical protein
MERFFTESVDWNTENTQRKGKSQERINGAGNAPNIRMEGRCPAETEFCQRSRFKMQPWKP